MYAVSIFPSKRKPSPIHSDGLLNLIEERQWTQIRKLLSSRKIIRKDSTSSTSKQFEETVNLLLEACRHDPLVSVVTSLIKAFPSAAHKSNSEKKFPLHVACDHGASPNVIRELLRANKDAALQRDVSGMLPIHRVCRFYYDTIDSWTMPQDICAYSSVLQILQQLLDTAPSSILEEDGEGVCPIEHALESGIHIDIIQSLQVEAEKERKLRIER